MSKSEIDEPIDGVSVLRQFLEELWFDAAPSLAKLSSFQRERLCYIRDELLEMKEPSQIAHYLGFIARAFEAVKVSQSTVISIHQFALQCHPTHTAALDASIRIFSRLNRWSMVLKLLKLKSTKGTSKERLETLYEMGHVYMGFYGSEEGLNSVLSSVESLNVSEGGAETDLWFTLVTLGTEKFKPSRYQRVLKRLNHIEDFGFRSALTRIGVDHALLAGDLTGLLAGLGESSVDGLRRTVIQLTAMFKQRRVPEGLSDFSGELTERERFSLSALNELLFRSGFFDRRPDCDDPQAWVLGWLLGVDHRDSSDIDRAFQMTQSDDKLGSLVALVSLVNQSSDTLLTRIQTQHLLRRSPLLGQMKLMQTLWSSERFRDLAQLLSEIVKKRPPSMPEGLTTFRGAEILEAENQLETAQQQFLALLKQYPKDWQIWASAVRCGLKCTGMISELLRSTIPVSTLEEHGRLVVESWLLLEESATGSQGPEAIKDAAAVLDAHGIECDLSVPRLTLLTRLRDVILAPSLSMRRFRIYPVEPHQSEKLGVHVYVALEWLLVQSPGQLTQAQINGLIGALADEPDGYGVALHILRNNGLKADRVDEVLGAKMPQQSTTFLAASERIVRRRRLPIGVEETGDLGYLIGRRLHPGMGHELVSLRAWTMVFATQDWSQAMEVWASLVKKSVGCLSAELGLVCGFVQVYKTREERKTHLEVLHGQLTNEALRRILRSWDTLLDSRANPQGNTIANASHGIDEIVQDCVRLYGAREVEALSNTLGRLERAGWSKSLSASMSAHLAKAQELSGDILSAFRTHERIDPAERCQISNI